MSNGADADAVDAYLRMKEQEFARTESVLRSLGRADELGALRELLRSHEVWDDVPVIGDTPEQREAVVEALARTAAQYLAIVGTRLQDVAEAGKAGQDVVGSAARIIAGGAEFGDLVAVAERVVPGIIERTAIGPGGVVTIRALHAQPTRDGATVSFAGGSSHRLEAGRECIFFLSPSLARFRNATDQAVPPVDVVQQFEPYCRQGGVFRSTSAYLDDALDVQAVYRTLSARKLVPADP